MRKLLLVAASSAILLASCSYPSDYQDKPARDMVIGWKPYKVTNVSLCDFSSCDVWVVYPADGSGATFVQSTTPGKSRTNVETIIVQ